MNRKRTAVVMLLAGAVGAAIASPAPADQIQLKDGRTVNGAMHRDGSAMVIRTDTGETIMTTPDQIVHVTLTSNLTPAQAAEADWNHTAFLIRNSTDLAAIIALHQKFLDKYPDQEISGGVRASMGEYQKLQRQGAVKFRGRWMPAAEIDTTLRTWHDNARPAIELYRSGKLREAFDAAKKIVLADAQNPEALATAGLAAFRLNNLADSRFYFNKLAAADPSSPLAENNLAVIAAQQNNFAESLIHYTKALQSAPGNRLVLDNIEEALATYDAANGDKTNDAYRDLRRQFDQAEGRMETDLAKKNLYRYGSTWVSKNELSRLTATAASIQADMAGLNAQYIAARQTLTSVNAQITQADNDYNTALNNINSLNNVVNGSNNAGLDVSSMITQRQNLLNDLENIRAHKAALEAQRDQITLSFGDLYAQADKLKAALASSQGARFSGLQRMMELGDDRNPPPPAPLPAPKVAAAPPAQPPAPPAPAPLPSNQQYQQDVIDTYGVVSDPFGYQIFPSFPQRVPTRNHDDNHGSGGNYPAPPYVPPTRSSLPAGGNIPGAPYGPSMPRHSTPATPAAPSSGTVGSPGYNSVAPGPRNSTPATPPAGPETADPSKAVPQGGPNSPFSNGR